MLKKFARLSVILVSLAAVSMIVLHAGDAHHVNSSAQNCQICQAVVPVEAPIPVLDQPTFVVAFQIPTDETLTVTSVVPATLHPRGPPLV